MAGGMSSPIEPTGSLAVRAIGTRIMPQVFGADAEDQLADRQGQGFRCRPVLRRGQVVEGRPGSALSRRGTGGGRDFRP